MAYSRWLGSRWYTYWRVQPQGSVETRDNAIFEVCGVESFTAAALREDIDKCLEATRFACGASEVASEPPTDEEMEELRSYMLAFLEDVDNDDVTAMKSL